jgi:hypothetical protein
MSKVFVALAVSVDGYITGRDRRTPWCGAAAAVCRRRRRQLLRSRRRARDRPADNRGNPAAQHLQRVQRPAVRQPRTGGRPAGDHPRPALDLLPGRQSRPGENPCLDITRLAHDTGFAPAFDVASAVADYVAWRADNFR